MPPIRKHLGSTVRPTSLQIRLPEQRIATGEASSSEDELALKMSPTKKQSGSTVGSKSLQMRLREQRVATGEASSSRDELLQIAQLRSKVETESTDTSIRDMMLKKLPQELFDLIEHYFYELAFVPGYLYPNGKLPLITQGKPYYLKHNPTDHELSDWNRRSKARPSLLRLSKDIYFRYRERMYNENTIVWGSGRINNGGKHLHDVIPTQANIELVFGSRDFETVPCNKFSKPEEFTTEKMLSAWNLRFLLFGGHTWSIDELTLDFRQCFDPDGKWLGYRLMKEWFGKTRAPKPNRITFLAPDMEKVNELSLHFHRKISWAFGPR
ncbi:MAG: hypothetical protein Q9221_008629 [Calogaya cf. arnoldii]